MAIHPETPKRSVVIPADLHHNHNPMKNALTMIALVVAVIMDAQNITGNTTSIRGSIVDKQSQYPIPGATVVVPGFDPPMAAVSDAVGNFRLENVPVGRQTVQVQMLGYEPMVFSNLLLNSGKEFTLNVQLAESVTTLNTVEITATDNKAESINKMSTVSTRTISIEEAQRFSGTLQDIARMAQNYAGVSGTNDGRNDIIIRGNSPTGVLWRMEGIDIPNPNHFSTLATTGGPISLINTNNVANSDFSTGAFAAEYGNALSGVFDLKLRSGNSDKREYMAQMGFNGFELGAEGPFKKGKQASYMINGRYSFLNIMTNLGIDFGTGAAVPEYQDLTFKVDLPTKKAVKFTFFGIGGTSFIDFRGEESGEENLYNNGKENQQFKSSTGVLGMTHSYFFNEKTYGKLIIATTTGGTQGWIDTLDMSNNATRTYGVYQRQNDVKAHYFVNTKISAKHTVKAGAMYDYYIFDVEDSIRYTGNYFFRQNDFEGETSLARGYAEWQYRPAERWTINTGIYGQYFVLNEKTSLEPRAAARYKINDRQSLSLGTGLHSQLQPITAYFNREEGSNGEVIANNLGLDFNKSAHFVLAHDAQLGKNMRMKTELYYQYLFNIAVDQAPTSFSILNVGADFTIPNNANLVNDGTGNNYGIEITLERFLNKGFYFLSTVSVFESTYKGSDGIERNTAFNGNYVLNALAGKEWKVGKNNAITLDFKTTYSGGRRFSPIMLDESIASREEVRDESRAFSGQYDAYFRTDIKAGFRLNGARFAQAFYFDVRNVTNHENIFMETFNARSNKVNTVYQTGFFPIFLYQVWF
jgi:hypothetical protein